MKFGIRKPSIKKSISARTTGKIKRKIKKAINPLYGKKGMGQINDPEKARYNAVYNKTSLGARKFLKHNVSSKPQHSSNSDETIDFDGPGWGFVKYFYIALLFVLGFFTLPLGIGVVFIGLGIFFIIRNKQKKKEIYNSNNVDESEVKEQTEESI